MISYEEAIEKRGMQTKAAEIARVMLGKLDLATEIVQEATGLSQGQLERIKEHLG